MNAMKATWKNNDGTAIATAYIHQFVRTLTGELMAVCSWASSGESNFFEILAENLYVMRSDIR